MAGGEKDGRHYEILMLLFASLKCEREESTIIDRKGYGVIYDYIRRLFMESKPLLLFCSITAEIISSPKNICWTVQIFFHNAGS